VFQLDAFTFSITITILLCNYSDLELIIAAYVVIHVPVHRGIQVSIGRQRGDSDVNLETFTWFYQRVLHVYISFRNLD